MSSSSITILVVEPDLRRANQIVASLSTSDRFSCECLRAERFSEALRALSRTAVELVVCRGSLPDVSYAAAIEQLRANASGASLVVLLEDEEKALIFDQGLQGADDCVFYRDLGEGRLEDTVHLALERRSLLEELRQLQTKASGGQGSYRALLHNLEVAVFLVSKPEGALLFHNQVAEAWFSNEKEGLLRELFEYGILEGESVEIEIETRYAMAPHAELRAVDMEWRGQRRCLVTLRNISKRKRAEAAYKSSQRRLDLALKASNIGLWSWDLRTNLIQFSERWKEQLGYSGPAFPNSLSAFREALHVEDRERVEKAFKSAFRGETTEIELEYRMWHRDGSARWILSRAELFPDATGRLSTLLGSHIDVTERRQRLESGVGVSNSPLAGKLSLRLERMATQLEEQASRARSSFRGDSEIVARIQEVERLARGLSCLNAVQRDSSQGEGGPHSLELGAEVSELYRNQENLLPAKIELQVEACVAVTIKEMSRSALRVVLTEALLCVSDRVSPEFKNRILVSVREEGVNGGSSNLACVEFSYRGSPVGNGALAELSQTQGLRAHASVSNGQSVLKLVFGKSPAAPQSGETSEKSFRPLALLAEDEGVLRLAIQAMLESLDYEVVVAEDGAQAVDAFERRYGDFSIALVDLNMPELGGDGVLASIRAKRPRLPVIKMSGDDDAWEAESSDFAGSYCQVLSKPFGAGDLKAAIREIRECGLQPS